MRSADGFRWDDGRAETVTEVVRREGVRFTDDAAAPERRLGVDELKVLPAAE